jgi:hypothetical protein
MLSTNPVVGGGEIVLFVLASMLSWLVDLATLPWQSDRDKALEILLLRRRLAILQCAQMRPVRPTRWEKLGLAVLAGKLPSLPAEGVTRETGMPPLIGRRRHTQPAPTLKGRSGQWLRWIIPRRRRLEMSACRAQRR